MERFENQKALLAYLGRNTDDRKWVKRRMEEGLIWKEDWMFCLSDKIDWTSYKGSPKKEKEKEKSESNEVKIDDAELKKLKAMNEKLMAAYKKLSKEKEVYMWMYDHLLFFYGKFNEWKKFVDGKVFWQTQYDLSKWIQQKEELVRDNMYEKYKFKYWEVEEAECEAVRKIIDQRASELAEIPF